MGGSKAIIGAVYAPSAYMQLSGGGSATTLIGSYICKSIVNFNNYTFHFDESLIGTGPFP
jgi:hypothetical protein